MEGLYGLFTGSEIASGGHQIVAVAADGAAAGVVVDDTLLEGDGAPLARNDGADAGDDALGRGAPHPSAPRERVGFPLQHPALWTGRGIFAPRGVLLAGPAGGGETACARAVAAETGGSFCVIDGPEILSQRAGVSETHRRRACKDAAAHAADDDSVLVCIDESDAIAPRRAATRREVDGVPPPGRRRAGAPPSRPVRSRARRSIPAEQGRLEIPQIETRDRRRGSDVNLEILARGSHGFVGTESVGGRVRWGIIATYERIFKNVFELKTKSICSLVSSPGATLSSYFALAPEGRH